MKLNNNIFINLFKYHPTQNLTPEENFNTELLVFLLRYSIENKTELVNIFFEKLELKTDKSDKIEIFTQKKYKNSIPDIAIESTKLLILIEVKVEADINMYREEEGQKEEFNQVEKYERIESNKDKKIFLLTKHAISSNFSNCESFIKNIRWHEIIRMMKDYISGKSLDIEVSYIKMAIEFWEERSMSLEKVDSNIISGIKSLNNLMIMLENSIRSIDGLSYKSGVGVGYIGYYIDDKNAWIGNSFNGNEIIYEIILNEERLERLKKGSMEFIESNKFKNFKNKLVSKFILNDNFLNADVQTQERMVKDWVSEKYELTSRVFSLCEK